MKTRDAYAECSRWEWDKVILILSENENESHPSILLALPNTPFCAVPKLAWLQETRETATLDAFRRSRFDASAAADDEAELLRYVRDAM